MKMGLLLFKTSQPDHERTNKQTNNARSQTPPGRGNKYNSKSYVVLHIASTEKIQ